MLDPATPLPFTPLADNCLRDNRAHHLADDGSRYVLEWTPTLNDEALRGSKLRKLIEGCELAGGGWSVPTRAELQTLVNHDTYSPAAFEALKEDTRSDYYITSTKVAWSSGRVWFVYFGGGLVLSLVPGLYGFARGVRRVPVLAGQ